VDRRFWWTVSVLLNAVVVIPARLASSRFPEKILARETGKYLIQHVHEQASRARLARRVIIAADDPRTMEAARSFGAPAVLTDPALSCGTDRVAAAVKDLDVDVVVNVQGDEPKMHPEAIDQLIGLMAEEKVSMATLATPFKSRKEIANPNCVKVVLNKDQFAVYFSRSIVPFPRDGFEALPGGFEHLLHLGIYAYRKEFLLTLTRLAPSPLERIEMLEQLRALWYGYNIKVGITPYRTSGIDTPEQYKVFVEEYLKNSCNRK
jgi:3-deoxy-manno-octulosonate cytidylyltransferase (CMP-KDO synthetase)